MKKQKKEKEDVFFGIFNYINCKAPYLFLHCILGCVKSKDQHKLKPKLNFINCGPILYENILGIFLKRENVIKLFAQIHLSRSHIHSP